MGRLIPVILSGGAGTRLWPASGSKHPRQLLALAGEQTMLLATALRTREVPESGDRCIVVSNESHRFTVAQQIHALGMHVEIILEPERRNTAPAVALAALEADPEDVLLVMPADHVIKNLEAFQAAVAAGIPAAEQRGSS